MSEEEVIPGTASTVTGGAGPNSPPITSYEGTLERAFCDVRRFHKTFGVHAPDEPQAQSSFLVERRIGFITEELGELAAAETLTDQADAYLDIAYFAMGGLVELGIEPSRLWDIVQAANMAKLWADGKPRLREPDGKIIKPEGWERPEPLLEAEIQRQLSQAAGDGAHEASTKANSGMNTNNTARQPAEDEG